MGSDVSCATATTGVPGAGFQSSRRLASTNGGGESCPAGTAAGAGLGGVAGLGAAWVLTHFSPSPAQPAGHTGFPMQAERVVDQAWVGQQQRPEVSAEMACPGGHPQPMPVGTSVGPHFGTPTHRFCDDDQAWPGQQQWPAVSRVRVFPAGHEFSAAGAFATSNARTAKSIGGPFTPLRAARPRIPGSPPAESPADIPSPRSPARGEWSACGRRPPSFRRRPGPNPE